MVKLRTNGRLSIDDRSSPRITEKRGKKGKKNCRSPSQVTNLVKTGPRARKRREIFGGGGRGVERGLENGTQEYCHRDE